MNVLRSQFARRLGVASPRTSQSAPRCSRRTFCNRSRTRNNSVRSGVTSASNYASYIGHWGRTRRRKKNVGARGNANRHNRPFAPHPTQSRLPKPPLIAKDSTGGPKRGDICCVSGKWSHELMEARDERRLRALQKHLSMVKLLIVACGATTVGISSDMVMPALPLPERRSLSRQ